MVHRYHASIWHRCGDIAPQRKWSYDLDPIIISKREKGKKGKVNKRHTKVEGKEKAEGKDKKRKEKGKGKLKEKRKEKKNRKGKGVYLAPL